MAIQMADSALLDRRINREASDHAPVSYVSDPTEHDDQTTAGRGIVTAVVISTPFWALIAFTIYLLL